MKISKAIAILSGCYVLQEDLVLSDLLPSALTITSNVILTNVLLLSFDYSFNGNLISRVLLLTYLEVICDRELNFRNHYKIIQSANSTLGFVFR